MALVYESFPPTAQDVNLDPQFISTVESTTEMGVNLYQIGLEDARRLCADIKRNEVDDIHYDLEQIRKALAEAAATLTRESDRDVYLSGVAYFISIQAVG